MRVLVTNDDGVAGPGLHALAQAVASTGHEVVIAAPDRDMSGSSAAIGMFRPDESIGVEQVALPGLDGVPAYAIEGPPGLAVLAARLGAFGPEPDLVVSGINPGPNTGRATLHSGTVGAALTAANFGCSALAVSIGGGDEDHLAMDEPRWASASYLAVAAIDWLVSAPAATVVNLNVPNLPLDRVRGVRWAELAPLGTVRAAVVGADEGRLQMELRPGEDELPEGTDTRLVLDGYAAATVIVGVRAAERAPVGEHLDRALAEAGASDGLAERSA